MRKEHVEDEIRKLKLEAETIKKEVKVLLEKHSKVMKKEMTTREQANKSKRS